VWDITSIFLTFLFFGSVIRVRTTLSSDWTTHEGISESEANTATPDILTGGYKHINIESINRKCANLMRTRSSPRWMRFECSSEDRQSRDQGAEDIDGQTQASYGREECVPLLSVHVSIERGKPCTRALPLAMGAEEARIRSPRRVQYTSPDKRAPSRLQ
jgi:hypothetical protein